MHEDGRQAIHILFGLALFAAIFLLPRDLFIIALAGVVFIGLLLIDLVMEGYRVPLISRSLDLFERPGVFPGKGAFFFGVSALVTAIMVPGMAAVGGVLILTLLDGVSALAGTRFGRHRIDNGKSLEGTAAGIVASIIPLSLFFPLHSAAIAVGVSALLEFLLPVDDNLVICPVAAFILCTFP